jgi:formyltetrahydrofolate synthetase
LLPSRPGSNCAQKPAVLQRSSGDFHAITSAHNLLAALVDAHMFHGNPLDLDPDGITWPRTLDMNDRALRNIMVSVTAAHQHKLHAGK